MAVSSCALCGEIKKDSSVVYEDKYCLCILDKWPVKRGHLLIIPRRHITSESDLTEKESKAIFDAIGKIRADFPNKLGKDIFLLQNPKPRRSQLHLHFHLIPYKGKVDLLIALVGDLILKGPFMDKIFRGEISKKELAEVKSIFRNRPNKVDKKVKTGIFSR